MPQAHAEDTRQERQALADQAFRELLEEEEKTREAERKKKNAKAEKERRRKAVEEERRRAVEEEKRRAEEKERRRKVEEHAQRVAREKKQQEALENESERHKADAERGRDAHTQRERGRSRAADDDDEDCVAGAPDPARVRAAAGPVHSAALVGAGGEGGGGEGPGGSRVSTVGADCDIAGAEERVQHNESALAEETFLAKFSLSQGTASVPAVATAAQAASRSAGPLDPGDRFMGKDSGSRLNPSDRPESGGKIGGAGGSLVSAVAADFDLAGAEERVARLVEKWLLENTGTHSGKYYIVPLYW